MKSLALSLTIITFILSDFALGAGLEKQGKLSIFANAMPGQTDRDVGSNQLGAEGNADFNYTFKNQLKLRFQPWLKIDSLNKSAEEKNQFEALELNLAWKEKSTQAKAGLSSINWEGTDFLNPMDLANAKNYRDPLNISNRSSAMLAVSSQSQRWGIDAVYIPWKSADLLPGTKSPWLPRYLALPTENQDTQFIIPDQVRYDLRPYQSLNSALKDNAALRLRYQGDQWDFAVAGATEASSPALLHPIAKATIIVAPAKVLQLQNPIVLQPVYYKQRTIAFAFTKSWETWILRASGRHSQPISDNTTLNVITETGSQNINITVPSWSQFGVIELEKHFTLGDEDLTLITEYAESKKPSSSGVSSFSSALQNVYLIGLRWPFKETWSMSAAIFQDYKTKANYAHGNLSKSWNDNWSSDLSVDLFSGGSESLLGVYDKNDQIGLKTNFAF